MWLTAATIVFVLLIAWWTTRQERTHAARTLTAEADEAARSIRTVARKRAKQASIPMPMNFEGTPVQGVPITPTPQPATRVSRTQYAQHKGRGNLKILKP